MARFVALFVLGGVIAAFGAFACGPDKPPLTPDTEHPADDAGASPAPPAMPQK